MRLKTCLAPTLISLPPYLIRRKRSHFSRALLISEIVVDGGRDARGVLSKLLSSRRTLPPRVGPRANPHLKPNYEYEKGV